MVKFKGGFTLIEVTLFLAITGLLFIGVTIGVQNSVFQQRYNDSVQSFADFLRNVYAETMNVQGKNSQGGNKELAIYGRLVAFGEKKTPTGGENVDGEVFVYDVVGDANSDVGTIDVLSALEKADANVLMKGDNGKVVPAGIVESFTPKWGSRIEAPEADKNDKYVDFSGLILVIRHPGSGTVYTYVRKGNDLQVNEEIVKSGSLTAVPSILKGYLNEAHFDMEQVDFCVNPTPSSLSDNQNSNRVDVRISKGARNSSAIETIVDVGDNVCRK